MTVSNQQKYGLCFAAVCCILFGGAIATCGLLFQYHDDYNDNVVNGMGYAGYYRHRYTQYWLAVPLIILGVLVFLHVFLFSKARPLLYVCIVWSSLTLTLAIIDLVLNGSDWSLWLSRSQAALDNGEEEFNGTCLDNPAGHKFTGRKGSNVTLYFLYNEHLGLSCKEIHRAALIQSIMTICSILSILVSRFIIFLSIRILDRMPQQRSYDTLNNRNLNAYNHHSNNARVMSEM